MSVPGEIGKGGDPAAARAYLRTESGHRIDLVANRVYIMGRAENCDVQVDDGGCSRRHARLSVAGDCSIVFLQDLSSKNGTYVNEERLRDRVQLKDGDKIRIGETRFTINLWSSAAEVQMDTRTNLLGK